MDHAEAVRTAATERYLLGELIEKERDAFEEHFFCCPECATDVRATATFLEDAGEILAEAPAPARWSPFRGLTAAAARWSSFRWPVPVGLAAACLALVGLAGYQNLVQWPRLRQEIARADAPQSVAWSFVSVSRSAPQMVTVADGQRLLGLTLSRSATRNDPFYRCEVRNADGKTVETAVVPAPAGGEELNLVLPTRRLRPGPLTVVLTAVASPDDKTATPEIARYSFVLQRR